MNEYKFDIYSKLVSICANVLVLGAVTLSMYLASFQPDTHLSAFCSWFFAMLVPILGGAWLSKRALRRCRGDEPHDDNEDSSHSAKASNGLTGIRLSQKI